MLRFISSQFFDGKHYKKKHQWHQNSALEMGMINVAVRFHVFLYIPVIVLSGEKPVILRSDLGDLGIPWDAGAGLFGMLLEQPPSLRWYPGHWGHTSLGGVWTARWWRSHSLSLTAVGSPGFHLPQGLPHLPRDNPGKGTVVKARERRQELPTLQEVVFPSSTGGTSAITKACHSPRSSSAFTGDFHKPMEEN